MVSRGVLQQVAYGILRAAGSPRSVEQDISIGILLGVSHAGNGPETGACGLTAAWLLGMLQEPPEKIHIVTRRNVAPREGYEFHETSRLPIDELSRVRNLWTTDGPRTFLDLCGTHPHLANWAYRRGLRAKALDEDSVLRRLEIESRQGRSGLTLARRIVDNTPGSAHRAKSGLEDRYHDYLTRAGYPAPERNVKLPGSFGHDWEVDLYYPQLKAGFEISPWITHGSPETHERDGRKAMDLAAQGFQVWPVTENLTFEEFVRLVRPLLGPAAAFPRSESVG